jgi:hypothetical protein
MVNYSFRFFFAFPNSLRIFNGCQLSEQQSLRRERVIANLGRIMQVHQRSASVFFASELNFKHNILVRDLAALPFLQADHE